jgi:hypothetical protein
MFVHPDGTLYAPEPEVPVRQEISSSKSPFATPEGTATVSGEVPGLELPVAAPAATKVIATSERP